MFRLLRARTDSELVSKFVPVVVIMFLTVFRCFSFIQNCLFSIVLVLCLLLNIESRMVKISSTKQRLHKCNFTGCQKHYTTKFSLKRHLFSHRQVKPFACRVCQQRFTLRQYLREHFNVHTGKKPFCCKVPGCNKAFRQAGKLSVHKKVHRNILFNVIKVKRKNLAPQ